jgi:predicted RNA-binding Zn ribbon-like protein
VQFDHHNVTGVHLAVALVNLEEPWDRAELVQVLLEHWVERVDLDARVCAELRQLVGRLRPVFEAVTAEARCEAVNTLLTGHGGTAFLITHDGLPPHLHFASSDDDLVSRVRAFTAGSLAIFTVEAEGLRLGSCARTGCKTVFADTSRNGRRAYCSSRCANGDAVQRHRRRHAAT